MKNFKLTSNVRKRGISLIEGVLYLVIALAVIVGGIVFFQQAQLSNQVSETSRASVGISSQTRALFQNQREFDQGVDLTAALVNSGSVPSNFLGTAAGTIQHPFGGSMDIVGHGDGFVMTMTDLSVEACIRLSGVSENGDGALGTGIEGITFLGTGDLASDLVAFPNTEPGVLSPISPTDSGTNCEENVSLEVFFTR